MRPPEIVTRAAPAVNKRSTQEPPVRFTRHPRFRPHSSINRSPDGVSPCHTCPPPTFSRPPPAGHRTACQPPGAGKIVRVGGFVSRVNTNARGLELTWALAFLPGGAMLVTERPGRLRRRRHAVRATCRHCHRPCAGPGPATPYRPWHRPRPGFLHQPAGLLWPKRNPAPAGVAACCSAACNRMPSPASSPMARPSPPWIAFSSPVSASAISARALMA